MVKLGGVRYHLVVSRHSKSLNRIPSKKVAGDDSTEKKESEEETKADAAEGGEQEKVNVTDQGEKVAEESSKDGDGEAQETAKDEQGDAAEAAKETSETAEESTDKDGEEKEEDKQQESTTPELKAKFEPKISASQLTARWVQGSIWLLFASRDMYATLHNTGPKVAKYKVEKVNQQSI